MEMMEKQVSLAERERIARELQVDTARLEHDFVLELQGIAEWARDPDVIRWLENFVEQLDQGMSRLRRLAAELTS
ncbi:MAG TPA: hypothetical protein VKF59_07310 [Candidatus Dormibacteraeota bacterium]|nr:hypothetical protein [Candidatus Dormibacteraeota bacterium]